MRNDRSSSEMRKRINCFADHIDNPGSIPRRNRSEKVLSDHCGRTSKLITDVLRQFGLARSPCGSRFTPPRKEKEQTHASTDGGIGNIKRREANFPSIP